MDMCTPMQFANALMHPDICLRRFSALCYDPNTKIETKHFTEYHASYANHELIIYAPASLEAVDMTYDAIRLRPKRCPHISALCVVPNEILCSGIIPHRCSLIFEELPQGTPLSEAMYTHKHKHLEQGLVELQNYLKEIDLSINNLKPENIIVDSDHHWHVIRAYYLSYDADNDDAIFERLKELIALNALSDNFDNTSFACEGFAPYGCITTTDGRQLFAACEGLRRFTSSEGTGFEDEAGNIIIEATFRDATDFLEDRSVVTTHDAKMGIIDRKGRYIIDPLYDSIDFDVEDGISRVVDGNKIAKFDYFGTRLTEWEPIKY